MDNEELVANQRVTIAEAVRDMPQISTANTVGNWTTPTNSINLRGLGSRATLILLNGQRQTIDANNASQVDINNLAPAIMLERIELLLDGASALYGSDAVAGVANFITRNDFEGTEFSISSQHSSKQSSVPEVLVGGLFGVQGADMGLVMGLEYLLRPDRMDVERVYSPERLGEGLITGFYNPGSFGYIPEGGGRPIIHADPLCGDPLIGGLPGNVIWDPAGAINHDFGGKPVASNPSCRGTLSLQRTIIPQNEQLTGMAVVNRQFAGNFLQEMSLEMNFARVETLSSFGTGVPLLDLPRLGVILPKENPGVIDANQRDPSFPLRDFDRVFSRQASPLEGNLESFARQHTFRTALNLQGAFNEVWDWRLTGTMSWNQQEAMAADTITERYARAIQGYGGPLCKFNSAIGAANDPKVAPGSYPCQWWNPFASRLLAMPGDPTYNSRELQEWMTWGGLDRGESTLYALEAVVTGELFELAGGPTGVALGAQFRKQRLDIWTDPIRKDGGLNFNPQVLPDWSSDRDTDALFAEIVMYPHDTFEIDVAARYEDTAGQSSVEPKISALWTPTDDLFFRASAGSSFRLPSENQLFGTSPGPTSIRAIGGEVTQARTVAVGVPDLLPEESDNWTVGFTWDVTDNLTLEATWWDYEFTNLVTQVSPDDISLADQADGFITDPRIVLFEGRPNEVCEVTRGWDPDGDVPLPEGCINGFDIALFRTAYINQAAVETTGADINIDYRWNLMGGEAGLRLNGVYVNRYAGIAGSNTGTDIEGTIVDVVGTDGGNVAGVGWNPQVRANLVATYRKGNHSMRWTSRFVDGTELRNPHPAGIQDNTIEGGHTTHDFVYTYALPTASDSSFTLAILNVADSEPPLVENTLTTIRSDLFDPRRRMIRASLNFGF